MHGDEYPRQLAMPISLTSLLPLSYTPRFKDKDTKGWVRMKGDSWLLRVVTRQPDELLALL